jgi:hypothetical protein
MQSPNSESALTDSTDCKEVLSPVVFSDTDTCSSCDVDLNSSSGNVPDLTTEFKTSSSDDVDVPDLIGMNANRTIVLKMSRLQNFLLRIVSQHPRSCCSERGSGHCNHSDGS